MAAPYGVRMSGNYVVARDAFLAQGEHVADMLDAVTSEQWDLPTRLSGWNVLTLAAHIREAPSGLVVRLRTPIAIPPTQDRVTYWRFTGFDVAATIDAEAWQAAARLTPETVPEAFRASLDEARRALSGAAPWTVVPLLFGSITVGELVIARIVELTIHTLDLSSSSQRDSAHSP